MGDNMFFEYTSDSHLRLLLRLDRGNAVRKAIGRVIEKGDRVLDAGTGTGLLSFMALQCGAESITAIDNANLPMAKNLAKENGWSEKINFINADLFDENIPGVEGKYDVVLGFMYMNNIVLDEERARVVRRLANQHGKNGVKVIPNGIRYSAQLVEFPENDVFTYRSDLDAARKLLESNYDMKFESLIQRVKSEIGIYQACPVYGGHYSWQPSQASASARFERGHFRSLSVIKEVFTHNLQDVESDFVEIPKEVTLDISQSGKADGVIWQQELIFDDIIIWTTETFSPFLNNKNVVAGGLLNLELDEEWKVSNFLK
ncbi:class I SAM-dependent methyltransferase [Pectobacterium brasiliense]|uniref:Class I SAM-dependent methyltransferase n=1 Tax=Pectobacterium brasiliense TaxID=180957 RepID=A0AAW9HGB1_9GAMM|nr:class I SAM-dependent methyltransferase [Pectobacterium brasiliense]MDY4379454.1 class I SAM-dependent methyltransferase [Pectobacterium brasiliense]